MLYACAFNFVRKKPFKVKSTELVKKCVVSLGEELISSLRDRITNEMIHNGQTKM